MSFHGLIAHIFLALDNIPLSDVHILFVHSPTEVRIGGFHILAVINKAAVNICYRFLCRDLNIYMCYFKKISDFSI